MWEPRNIYVKLPGDIADALIRVADEQWRLPRDQAAYFIADGLRRLGELPADVTLEPVGGPDRRAGA
jgi:hypothetical protein